MPKHNKKFDKPANARYKGANHLQRNKLRRIMKNQNVDLKEAGNLWESSKVKKK